MGSSRVKVCKKRRIPAEVRLDILDNYRAELVWMRQSLGKGATEPVYGEPWRTYLNHHPSSPTGLVDNGASLRGWVVVGCLVASA